MDYLNDYGKWHYLPEISVFMILATQADQIVQVNSFACFSMIGHGLGFYNAYSIYWVLGLGFCNFFVDGMCFVSLWLQ